MKKSFPPDDSFNFARRSLNRLIQSEQHHRTIFSQIPTWFLTHSHRAPPAFVCSQCQILSPTVVLIHHPKGLLHMPGILLKVAQLDILPALKPRQGRDGPALSPPDRAGSQLLSPTQCQPLEPALPSTPAEWNCQEKGTAVTQQGRILQKSCTGVTP